MSEVDFAVVDRAIRDMVDGQGFMQLVGARIDRLAPGEASFSLDKREALLQQNGFFHGGAIAFLIDVAATTAAATLIDRASQSCLTAEYKLNFVAPAKGERITCEAKVVKPGRMLTIVEAKVYSHENGQPHLASIALATIAMIDRSPAAA
jgi:uncharacterized protein (TIGR00369 family)